MLGLRGADKNAVGAGCRLHTSAPGLPSKKLRCAIIEAMSHVAVFPLVAICDNHIRAESERTPVLGSKDSGSFV